MNPPTPDELRAFMERHGLSQKELAERLPVALNTLERWLGGSRNPLPLTTRALRDLERELKRKKP